jgi:hypothetical protein
MTDGYLEHLRSECERARRRLAELERETSRKREPASFAPIALLQTRADFARLLALVRKIEHDHG